MTGDLVPVLTGQVVAPRGVRPSISVREVRAEAWSDDPGMREAAVYYWLLSVKSQHSRAAYRRDIDLWFAWCDDIDVPINDARRADIDEWRDQFTAAGLANATIRRRMSAVSSFYRYWHAEDVVARNPAANAARPSRSDGPASIALTSEQAAQLLAYVDQLADPRPAVIVRLLAETGMRVSELCGIRAADLAMDSGHYTLIITRKGDKTQTLAIASTTRHRITVYLNGRRDGWLVRAERTDTRVQPGGQLARQYVYDLLKRLAREAGLPAEVVDRMHPHVLRASCATIAAENRVPQHEIQRLLGHADPRTTAGYIRHRRGLDNSPVYTIAAAIAPDAAAGQ